MRTFRYDVINILRIFTTGSIQFAAEIGMFATNGNKNNGFAAEIALLAANKRERQDSATRPFFADTEEGENYEKLS